MASRPEVLEALEQAVAATNHPWDVDAALRRPGRLDRAVLVLPPDEPARAAILRYHLRDRPVERVDVPWLARRTDGWSGADLAMLCEAAAEQALEAAMYTGRPRPIGMGDCRRALRSLRPTTAPWFATVRNFVQFGNQGGIYDELLDHFRGAGRR